MGNQAILDFWQKSLQDEGLQASLKEIGVEIQTIDHARAGLERSDSSETIEKIVQIGSGAGYTFTSGEVKELLTALVATPEGELSDQELEQVAGGKALGPLSILADFQTSGEIQQT